MKVLQLNIRYSQGGAGRVARDLHRRLNEIGHESRYAYGYASGLKADSEAISDAGAIRVASAARVLINYASHKAIGREISTPPSVRDEISSADLVHIHCLHHYYLNPYSVLESLSRQKKPTVVTLHDWWFMTGRCANPNTCRGWQSTCGVCPNNQKADLPSVFDRSSKFLETKISKLNDLSDQITFLAPSKHIMRDFEMRFPTVACKYIPNTFDLDFEEILSAQRMRPRVIDNANHNPKILVIAADLSDERKTNREFVSSLQAATGANLTTIGQFSPFNGPRTINLGYVSSRDILVEQLLAADALIYTSQIDNSPLTLIEALACGTAVLSTESPAASELLDRVNLRTCDWQTARNAIEEIKSQAVPARNDARAALSTRAVEAFSPSSWLSAHLEVYGQAVAGQ